MTQTILATHIAGVTHARPNLDPLREGDSIILMPEPQNAHDSYAIAVFHEKTGQQLGYVPRDATVCIHDAVRNALPTTSRLAAIDAGGKFPKLLVVVTVDL